MLRRLYRDQCKAIDIERIDSVIFSNMGGGGQLH